ncbi:uncharacterized protein HMPREF1541_09350 [Cyphellophora europaea CBS 101466]|uniref:C3H1-type domain-containing protein n=1 Tax=Cyphellophora europaea (strain CBS 101466) TaxID=1220924 RepID=W2SBX7_CYPE1|nr:uncharacterized protein HMPREF1541_09350 [Cyphellophora europaea CBS 101466]ETN45518.1 hypothetical protein HMPREF1541_09350 [Cyphellophora europaea CBS 101466]
MASPKERLDLFRRQETNQAGLRNDLLDASFTSAEFLEKIESLQKELDQSRNAEKHYYDLMNQAMQENRDLQKSMDCNRFIAALIDGDSMPFLDKFVVRGFDGGVEVGRRLRLALSNYHRTNPLHRGDDKIVIYISANLHGLTWAYTLAGITQEQSRVRDFFVGLSQSHPLTSFVDAGQQKEAADSKLRAQVELYYSNSHCQQVIFGGSDCGYAPFLDMLANAEDINRRVTILSPAHMPHRMLRTVAQFLRVDFPEIFRATKIVTIQSDIEPLPLSGLKRRLNDETPPQQRHPPPPFYSGSHEAPTDINRVDEYSAGRHSPPNPDEYQPENPFLINNALSAQTYYVNQYGQRLDQPLLYDKQYLRFLFTKKARLCNNFYLRCHCPYGDSCQWDHSEDLTPLQIDTLRHKARTSACRDPYCNDVACTLGHMCPRPPGACHMDACKFSEQQHNVCVEQVFEIDPATGSRTQVTMSTPADMALD